VNPRERARRLATVPEQISIYGAIVLVGIGVMIGLIIGGMVVRAET
jgi:predicted Co/Zn/Cd cation transporter (cation efflux family)